MHPTADILTRAISRAEATLFSPPPLADLAEAAGLSPWHFHRTFTAVLGETPATYIRRRQISEVCRRLTDGDEPLVDLALSCGFSSQASFTRAFSRHVGVSPGRYRRERLRAPAYDYPVVDVIARIEQNERSTRMTPKLVEHDGFRVIGMAGRYDQETNIQIPSLWARFGPRISTIAGRRGATTFGVCCEESLLGGDQLDRLISTSTPEPPPDSATFVYVACVEVEAAQPAIPDDMVSVQIPANHYAVFTHRGNLSGLRTTTRRIWGEWLPASPHRPLSAPDFELYDERMDPETGEGELDIYVPIARPD